MPKYASNLFVFSAAPGTEIYLFPKMLLNHRSTGSNGNVLGTGVDNVDYDKIETDADGKSVGLSAPVSFPTHSNELYTSGWSFGSLNTGQYMVHVVDGIHVPAEFMWNRVDNRHGSLNLDLLLFSAAASQMEVGRWYRTRYKKRPGTGIQIGVVDDSGSVELSPWASTSEPSIEILDVRLLQIERV